MICRSRRDSRLCNGVFMCMRVRSARSRAGDTGGSLAGAVRVRRRRAGRSSMFFQRRVEQDPSAPRVPATRRRPTAGRARRPRVTAGPGLSVLQVLPQERQRARPRVFRRASVGVQAMLGLQDRPAPTEPDHAEPSVGPRQVERPRPNGVEPARAFTRPDRRDGGDDPGLADQGRFVRYCGSSTTRVLRDLPPVGEAATTVDAAGAPRRREDLHRLLGKAAAARLARGSLSESARLCGARASATRSR